MKRNLILLLTTVLTLGISGCGQASTTTADAGELNIYTWQGYVPPDIVTRFQEETGITINYSYFSTNEEMLAKLEATGGSDYDFIICSDYAIQLAAEDGLLQEIDSSRIENYKNINPVYQSQYYDPNNQYSIPYWICSKAILYNPAETDLTFENFSDLADPSLKGKVVVTNSERDVIGAALQQLGYDINDTDESHLLEAEAFLKNMRSNIMAFDTDNPEDFDKRSVVLLPDSVMENASLIENVGDAQEIYDRIWTELK